MPDSKVKGIMGINKTAGLQIPSHQYNLRAGKEAKRVGCINFACKKFCMLKPVPEEISYPMPGQIWKVLPCGSDRWVIEWRMPEGKRLGFSVIDPLNPDALVVQAAADGIDWWSSLAGVGMRCFFVHGYRNSDIPEPTDLMAFDMSTGEMRWVLPGYRFEGISEQKTLLVGRKDARGISVFECDELTGTPSAPPADSRVKPETGWLEAHRYTRGEEYYDFLVGFLKKSVGLSPAGAVEYLDYADKMVFSFYLYENNGLVQYVAVLDRFRKVRYLEAIEKDLEKEGKGGLVLREGVIYFIKNKNNFVGINLAV